MMRAQHPPPKKKPHRLVRAKAAVKAPERGVRAVRNGVVVVAANAVDVVIAKIVRHAMARRRNSAVKRVVKSRIARRAEIVRSVVRATNRVATVLNVVPARSSRVAPSAPRVNLASPASSVNHVNRARSAHRDRSTVMHVPISQPTRRRCRRAPTRMAKTRHSRVARVNNAVAAAVADAAETVIVTARRAKAAKADRRTSRAIRMPMRRLTHRSRVSSTHRLLRPHSRSSPMQAVQRRSGKSLQQHRSQKSRWLP